MSPVLLGIIIAGVCFLILAAKRSGERTAQEAMQKAQEATQENAEAIEEDKLPQVAKTTYIPKGKKMPKPVFLPTPAESTLEEDPVIEWEPVAIVDEEGVIDWDKTEANAIYANPKTGELIEYGHK